ncbi:GspS/AspS pilotin family protein [Vibrio cidicii]|uniref:GspS/AspS pilotin family protein n=1 Tax=Vibrio cidicii TaxID=1763883 RepID=UPI003F51A3C5
MFKKIICTILALSALAGCSSNDERERQLELMASNRAGMLSAGLPLEHGPLKVMRISANKSVIEMMMIYNSDAQGAKPTEQVLANSIQSYCNSAEIRSQLELGLAYRIKIRNSRGQLVADQLVTAQTCAAK